MGFNSAFKGLKEIRPHIKFVSTKGHVYGKRWKYGNPGIVVIVVWAEDDALRKELIIDATTSLVPIRLGDERRKGALQGRTSVSYLFLRNLFIAFALISVGCRQGTITTKLTADSYRLNVGKS